MRECPWCGTKNLNVYAYCQSCGRGFDPPEELQKEKKPSRWKFWPFGKNKAA